MDKKETVKKLNFEHKDYTYTFPGYCPICNCYFIPVLKFENTYKTSIMDNLIHYEVCECPACHNPFIAVWESSKYTDILKLSYLAPKKFFKKEFEEIIKNISPDFIDIYYEAEKAEFVGLLKICGAGYRKALEFLIKDYAIYLDPSEQARIEKETLHNTIQRLGSDRLKTAAKKCSWLGNDQVHYKFMHSNSDIEDMKNLLDATVHWIMLEEITKQNLS